MAVNFYNPVQSGVVQGQQLTAPGATPPAALPGGGYTQPPQNINKDTKKFGYLDTDQIQQKGWDTGQSFDSAAKGASIESLKNGMSSANPADYKSLDMLRNYYQGQLQDLPGLQADNISSFDTQSQRGLSNLLGQHANANAGTGRLGSRQFAGAEGDITARAMGEYNKGLLDARNNSINQAGAIGQGLEGVQNQDLGERKFQFDQGKSLSDLIAQQLSLDMGREGQLGAQRAQEDQANKQMWGQIIGGATGAAGMMLAPHPKVG